MFIFRNNNTESKITAKTYGLRGFWNVQNDVGRANLYYTKNFEKNSTIILLQNLKRW